MASSRNDDDRPAEPVDGPGVEEFSADFVRRVIGYLRSGHAEELLCGWTVYTRDDSWFVDLHFRESGKSGGRPVTVFLGIPAPGEDLGLDVDTYAMIQGSGVCESLDCDVPGDGPRLRFTTPDS